MSVSISRAARGFALKPAGILLHSLLALGVLLTVALLFFSAKAGQSSAIHEYLDAPVTLFINRFVSNDPAVNRAILKFAELPLITGDFLVALLWCFWFRNQNAGARAALFISIAGAVGSGVLSRVLQLLISFHPRPLHDQILGFRAPPGIDPTVLNHWSSFPSDHAAFLFALATVICLESAWFGVPALMSAAIGTLPRVYLGFHYPSDILGGAMLGVVGVLLNRRYVPVSMARPCLEWERRAPGLFYGAAVFMSFELASLFDGIREIGCGMMAVLKHLI